MHDNSSGIPAKVGIRGVDRPRWGMRASACLRGHKHLWTLSSQS
jgi:hypothetical protein